MKKATICFLIILSLLPASTLDTLTVTKRTSDKQYYIIRNGQRCSTHPAVQVFGYVFLTAFVYSCANGNVSRKTN